MAAVEGARSRSPAARASRCSTASSDRSPRRPSRLVSARPCLSTIERIVSFGPALRPAARLTGARSTSSPASCAPTGARVDLEEIRVRPAWHLTHAIHAAARGRRHAVSSTSSAPLGVLVILLIAAVSMYGDLTGRFYIVRLPDAAPAHRATCTSAQPRPGAGRARDPDRPPRRRRAPACCGCAGAAPARRGAGAAASRALAGPLDFFFWTVMVALVAALARLALDDSGALTVVQFVLAAILLTYVMLLHRRGGLRRPRPAPPTTPPASRRCSRSAAACRSARRAAIETWLVFPGAKEALALGMRAWLREHGDELDPRDTFFVNVDTVGHGRRAPRDRATGYALVFRSDERLARLCERAGLRSPTSGASAPTPRRRRWRAIPSITICCLDDARPHRPSSTAPTDTPERVDPAAVERAPPTSSSRLVRRIDDGLPPREPERRRARAAASPAPRGSGRAPAGSRREDMSPGSSPTATARTARRRIFAERVFGSAVDEHHARGLERPAELASRPARAAPRRRLVARAVGDHAEAPDRLALRLVRHAHDRRLRHRRVRHQHRLDLRRAEPLAGHVDRVVGAARAGTSRRPRRSAPSRRGARRPGTSTSRSPCSARGRPRCRASCPATGACRRARRPRRAPGCPSGSNTSTSMPCEAPPSEHTLISSTG